MSSKTSEITCAEAIIRQIEKQVRKGRVEGVLFDSCVTCDSSDNLIRTITVPATHISVSGSGVRWKAYGHSVNGEKARK